MQNLHPKFLIKKREKYSRNINKIKIFRLIYNSNAFIPEHLNAKCIRIKPLYFSLAIININYLVIFMAERK